jgi:hypothetical protein
MEGASTLYPPGWAGRRTGIASHKSVLEAQEHQGHEKDTAEARRPGVNSSMPRVIAL